MSWSDGVPDGSATDAAPGWGSICDGSLFPIVAAASCARAGAPISAIADVPRTSFEIERAEKPRIFIPPIASAAPAMVPGAPMPPLVAVFGTVVAPSWSRPACAHPQETVRAGILATTEITGNINHQTL
ncbi:hypothetical protein GCM10011380_33030 [Sphingomonas metalli]|uniref:Uncharacterized protein n=1 Tax=Sphingomonas metalli TaxID=1779358 RepID=A0A916WZ61_9SPHN|nr:hypothetical protein GCM10011380_33030 [Sphingomonas metalli]